MINLFYATKTINGTSQAINVPITEIYATSISTGLGDGGSAVSGTTLTIVLRKFSHNVTTDDKIIIKGSTTTALNNSTAAYAGLWPISSIGVNAALGLQTIVCTVPNATANLSNQALGAIGIVKSTYSTEFDYLKNNGYVIDAARIVDTDYIAPGSPFSRRHMMDPGVFLSRFTNDEVFYLMTSDHHNAIRLRNIIASSDKIYLTNRVIITLVKAMMNVPTGVAATSTDSGHILNRLWVHDVLKINRAEFILML